MLGLFSWTTLAAHTLQKHHPITLRTAAWYDKPSPAFVDAIALARRHLWLASEGFSLSAVSTDTQNSLPPSTTEWWTPSPMPLELRKVQLGATFRWWRDSYNYSAFPWPATVTAKVFSRSLTSLIMFPNR